MRYLLAEMLCMTVIPLLASGAVAETRPLPSACTYEMQVWNVNTKSSLDLKKIQHSYHDLRSEEIDPETGCTVCSEDQVLIDIRPLAHFFVCYKIAPRVRDTVLSLSLKGAPIKTITGYRVIKSRGAADENGNRTAFSNHSFGTAIDINAEQNGLYDNCIEFGPQCRLLRGGEWRPGTPGTLDKNNDIVVLLKREGFRWGGEIAGKQKDFMRFSMTGY
jgi:D-alanyl-D-alanine carboxypeptidase-like protein